MRTGLQHQKKFDTKNIYSCKYANALKYMCSCNRLVLHKRNINIYMTFTNGHVKTSFASISEHVNKASADGVHFLVYM